MRVQEAWQLSKVGVVARVLELMLPQNSVLMNEEHSRHRPRIADGRADEMPFESRSYAARPNFRAEHFFYAATLQAKAVVENLWQIRDGFCVAPQRLEEVAPVARRALIEKNDGRQVVSFFGDVAQIRDEFATKDATEVPYKNKQFRRVAQFFFERSPAQIHAFNRAIEQKVRNDFHCR